MMGWIWSYLSLALLISATITERGMQPASSSVKAIVAAPCFSPQAISKAILVAWLWRKEGKKETCCWGSCRAHAPLLCRTSWNHAWSPAQRQGNDWISGPRQLRKMEQRGRWNRGRASCRCPLNTTRSLFGFTTLNAEHLKEILRTLKTLQKLFKELQNPVPR